MELFESFTITRIRDQEMRQEEDLVVREFPLKILLNQQELVTLVCSPVKLDELAVGFLFSEGLLKSRDDILLLEQKEDRLALTLAEADLKTTGLKNRIITSGCGRSMIYTDLNGTGLKKVRTQLQIEAEKLLEWSTVLAQQSELFKKTGGVHNSLLVDVGSDWQAFREDIGRHNTVDKLIGHLILNGLPATTKILLTSGRITAEILLKTARIGLPMVVSASAPTDLAIRLAYRLGITLVGFVRGKRMNIYTHRERIGSWPGSCQ